MFCWGTVGPGIHVDVTLPRYHQTNTNGDQVHPTWQRHSQLAAGMTQGM